MCPIRCTWNRTSSSSSIRADFFQPLSSKGRLRAAFCFPGRPRAFASTMPSVYQDARRRIRSMSHAVTPQARDRRAAIGYGAILVTIITWASAFAAIRVGLQHLTPVELAAARYLTAAIPAGLYLGDCPPAPARPARPVAARDHRPALHRGLCRALEYGASARSPPVLPPSSSRSIRSSWRWSRCRCSASASGSGAGSAPPSPSPASG